MRFYELTVIFNSSLEDSSIQAEIDKIEKQISGSGGKIQKIDRWGLRRLAYLIQGFHQGYYAHFVFEAKPGLTSEIEKTMRINENILRFLTVIAVAVPVEEKADANAAENGQTEETTST